MFMSLNLKKDVYFGSNKRTQLRFEFVYSNFFFNLKNLSQNISDVLYAEYKNRVIKEMYEYKKTLKIFPFNKYCSEYLIDGFLTLLKTNNCY